MGMVLGRFKPSRQGGWDGEIQTLTINRKVRLIPNDDRVSEHAPSFRLMMGLQRIGNAGEEFSKGDRPREYLSVTFDDPAFHTMRKAALIPDADGGSALLVWGRSYL